MRIARARRRRRGNCGKARVRMSDFIDGELSSHASAQVKRHLRRCLDCGRLLRNLRRTIAGLGRLGDEIPGEQIGRGSPR